MVRFSISSCCLFFGQMEFFLLFKVWDLIHYGERERERERDLGLAMVKKKKNLWLFFPLFLGIFDLPSSCLLCVIWDLCTKCHYSCRLNYTNWCHMVIDISCLDKNLDLRLMLSTKRILTTLTVNFLSIFAVYNRLITIIWDRFSMVFLSPESLRLKICD